MFKVEFKTGNAAFEGEEGKGEIIRILRNITERVEYGYTWGSIMDINGNLVGSWELSE